MSIDDILDDFAYLDDWEDRYKFVIELGRELPPFEEAFKCDAYKVNGCVSQVWIKSSFADNGRSSQRMSFTGDSDALIVRGLIAILVTLYSGRTANGITSVDPEAIFAKIGLRDHLTAQRSNGLSSMLARIRRDAEQAVAA